MVNLIGVICNPLICTPLLLLGSGSVAIVTVTTIISITRLLINIYYCLIRLKAPFSVHGFELSLLREIAIFSFFIFLNMIIDQINWSIDKFIIGRISGINDVAVYGIGAQINTLYTGFSTAISSVFAPRVNRIANESKDRERLFTNLFIKVGRVQFIILGLIASGFIFFGKFFITNIYAGIEYNKSYYVALILILPASIPLIQNLGIEIQRAVNKHKFRSIIYFFMALANVLMSIPLARKYGPVGSAIGTGVTMIVANGIIMNYYYYRYIGINIFLFWKNIFNISKALAIPVLIGILIYRFVRFNNVFQFVLYIAIYSLVYVVSMYNIGMNQDEIVSIKKMLKRLYGRKNND